MDEPRLKRVERAQAASRGDSWANEIDSREFPLHKPVWVLAGQVVGHHNLDVASLVATQGIDEIQQPRPLAGSHSDQNAGAVLGA
jgi:hypothetical protein